MEDIDSCIDEQAERCILRLKSMDTDGKEIRREAIERIIGKKEEIREKLFEVKNTSV